MATTTVTQYPVSLRSFETVTRLEHFVQPLLPLIEKATDFGAQYYARVKKHSPYAAQVLTMVETLLESATEKVTKKVQEQVNENASKLESFDRTGVQLLDQVALGKQRIEKTLFGPAMFLLTVLNHISLFLNPSSKVESSDSSNQTTTVSGSPDEVTLAQTYQVLGQRSLEVGSELFKLSTKALTPVRLALVAQIPQLVLIEEKVQGYCRNWCRQSSASLLNQELKQTEQAEINFEPHPDQVAAKEEVEERQQETQTVEEQQETKEVEEVQQKTKEVEEASAEVETEEAEEEEEEEAEEEVEEEAEEEVEEAQEKVAEAIEEETEDAEEEAE